MPATTALLIILITKVVASLILLHSFTISANYNSKNGKRIKTFFSFTLDQRPGRPIKAIILNP